MPEKKQQPAFTVTDRRKFTTEGEVRTETTEEQPLRPGTRSEPPKPPSAAEPAAPAAPQAPSAPELEMPGAPSILEQSAQKSAYEDSNKQIDAQMRIAGAPAGQFDITFERFLASLYMSALVQLGLAHEQGGTPRLDIIGARQTIDTIALLQEKTKGNLTAAEDNFIRNSLYELRLAYVEVTNALTKPPQGAEPGVGKK